MLESIKTFLSNCPQISDIKNSFSDYKNLSSALHGAENEVLSDYIDGSRLMKFRFKICVREKFGPTDCAPALKACNEIASWIRKMSLNGNLPVFDESIFPQYIEIENDPVVAENTVSGALYQLNCYIVYYEKRR